MLGGEERDLPERRGSGAAGSVYSSSEKAIGTTTQAGGSGSPWRAGTNFQFLIEPSADWSSPRKSRSTSSTRSGSGHAVDADEHANQHPALLVHSSRELVGTAAGDFAGIRQ